MIPKIIHYCWLSNDPVPTNLQEYMKSWKKYLPDYEFWLWDLKRFDINSSIWVKEAFEVKKYAFAADYIRCYALYNYGGIYLDMDVEVLKSFNDLLHLPYFLGKEQKTLVEAAVMGAEKQSSFFKKMLEYYKERHFILEKGQYDTRTLPGIFENILKANFQIVNIDSIEQFVHSYEKVNILPPDWFSPKSYHSGKVHLTKNSYTIHHFSDTWIPRCELIELRIWQLLGLKPHFIIKRIKEKIAKF